MRVSAWRTRALSPERIRFSTRSADGVGNQAGANVEIAHEPAHREAVDERQHGVREGRQDQQQRDDEPEGQAHATGSAGDLRTDTAPTLPHSTGGAQWRPGLPLTSGIDPLRRVGNFRDAPANEGCRHPDVRCECYPVRPVELVQRGPWASAFPTIKVEDCGARGGRVWPPLGAWSRKYLEMRRQYSRSVRPDSCCHRRPYAIVWRMAQHKVWAKEVTSVVWCDAETTQ